MKACKNMQGCAAGKLENFWRYLALCSGLQHFQHSSHVHKALALVHLDPCWHKQHLGHVFHQCGQAQTLTGCAFEPLVLLVKSDSFGCEEIMELDFLANCTWQSPKLEKTFHLVPGIGFRQQYVDGSLHNPLGCHGVHPVVDIARDWFQQVGLEEDLQGSNVIR